MQILWIVIAVNAATFGFAFLLAGWVALSAPSDLEKEDIRRRFEAERQKGWIQGQLFISTCVPKE